MYTNQLNLELTQLLIQDFIHLSGYYLPFDLELKTMMKSSKHVDYGVEERIGDMNLKLLNAGHTPGSSQVLIEADGKRFLYTGDFNTADSKLLTGAKMEEVGDLDAVAIESTYANEDHTERRELEKRFVDGMKHRRKRRYSSVGFRSCKGSGTCLCFGRPPF